ncbi:MAG: hypothetical protein K5629_08215 [Eubacteriales bacterium]|nr:hypothetical protein [Eubacteriales bacterium]
MKIFDLFMENPYWKSVYEKAPSNECKEYYRIMFEYFSFETDEEDEEGIRNANNRLMELMLSREDAEYIRERTENPLAKHHYREIITWLFDGEKADTISASMFKCEIRNPGYVTIDVEKDAPSISSGSACFLIMDDSLKTREGEFWNYLKKEGFSAWSKYRYWGCGWVYVNVNSKLYAPGMPGVSITRCVVSKYPRNALSIEEFKMIWNILKEHEENT